MYTLYYYITKQLDIVLNNIIRGTKEQKLARYVNADHTVDNFCSLFMLIVLPDNRRFIFKEAENLMSLIKPWPHIKQPTRLHSCLTR